MIPLIKAFIIEEVHCKKKLLAETILPKDL